MNSRDSFEKCLNTVIGLMPTELDDAILLEHLHNLGRAGAQFFVKDKVYLLGFPESGDLLTLRVFEYEATGKRMISGNECVHKQFCEAYQRALCKFLKKVAQVGNTEYLCDAYATYFLSHYRDIMSA